MLVDIIAGSNRLRAFALRRVSPGLASFLRAEAATQGPAYV
jgi:hypothetical protein